MTDPPIALKDYLINIGLDADADFLPQGVQLLSQMPMEVEVEQQIVAGYYSARGSNGEFTPLAKTLTRTRTGGSL
jgi:hypothetical protein